MEKFTQRHNRKKKADLDDCDYETCTSSQFLKIQTKKLMDLQEHLERYYNVSLIFGFNSAKYDLNPIKTYLLNILVEERNIQPTVVKKANRFISFKLSDIQLLDFMNFFGGATSLDSFLKKQNFREKKIITLRMV